MPENCKFEKDLVFGAIRDYEEVQRDWSESVVAFLYRQLREDVYAQHFQSLLMTSDNCYV